MHVCVCVCACVFCASVCEYSKGLVYRETARQRVSERDTDGYAMEFVSLVADEKPADWVTDGDAKAECCALQELRPWAYIP